jgi:glycosyltransferase involved in cell wall biosynthesis
MNKIAAIESVTHLAFGLDAPLPAEIVLGKGVVLRVRGWCYSSDGPLNDLAILIDDAVTPIPNHSWARMDVFAEQCPGKDRSGYSLLSGFEGFLPLDQALQGREVELTLRATLKRGDTVDRPLGRLQLHSGYGPNPTAVDWPATSPRVAICMATYNPPLTLFKAQIASLRAQTHTNWVCIIMDDYTEREQYDRICYLVKNDSRFHVFQNRRRQNFYRNFQEGLRRVPADADFVALCDQDDVWNADKLQTLLDAFKNDTQLVYSDARVVDETGDIRSETFWTLRRNNFSDLSTLMVANTITGAASMIRASLLAEILPFPEPIGPAFHDHWIGLAALMKGSIGYVDRPLYDYVQHAEGVIGHNYNEWGGLGSALKQMLRAAPRRGRMAQTATMLLKQSFDDYTFVLQKIMLARTLLLRNPGAQPEKRDIVLRFANFETSIRAALHEKITAMRTRRPTLNLEGMFLWAIAGTRLRNYAFRYKRRDLLRLQTERPGTRLLHAVIPAGTPSRIGDTTSAGLPIPAPSQNQAKRGGIPVLEFGSTKWIHHNISGLTLDISEQYPKRANVLLATIDFKYVFGGYIGMFNLALRLKRQGYRVRIILHEQTEWDMEDWRCQIQKYPGITTLFDEIETISRFDRTIPVEVNPSDRFVATNCWAAHIANATIQLLEEKRFLFMVQEYEPYFMGMSSINALFRQAYTFPQVSLFSTRLLQDFFRREQIGVFARPDGEHHATMFSNAIQKFYPTRELLLRTQRRLLFYARPEEHAARNLFELGMIALVQLVRDPRVNLANWSFHGIGSIDRGNTLELAPGIPLKLVPKTSLDEYIALMPSFDVGLSLMLTPHPSLVPIEMASAGMWTVTNTYANKTADELRAISSNLIGVEPTVSAIRDGLVEAMARVDEVDNRLAGAKVAWPTDWNQAFPDEAIQKIEALLGTP